MKKMMNKFFNKESLTTSGMQEAYTFVGTGNYTYDVIRRANGKWGLRVSFKFDVFCEELDSKMSITERLVVGEFMTEVNAYKGIKIYQEEKIHRERMIGLMEKKAREEIIYQFEEDARRNLKNEYLNKSFDIKVELSVDKSLLKKGNETNV